MRDDTGTPPNNLLSTTFKNAANSIALLYREAQSSSKKAQESGYEACLQDLWSFISQDARLAVARSTGTIPLTDLELFIRQKYFELQEKRSQGSVGVTDGEPGVSESPLTALSSLLPTGGTLSAAVSTSPVFSESSHLHIHQPQQQQHQGQQTGLLSHQSSSTSVIDMPPLHPPHILHSQQQVQQQEFLQQLQQQQAQAHHREQQQQQEQHESLKRRWMEEHQQSQLKSTILGEDPSTGSVITDSPTKRGRFQRPTGGSSTSLE